VSAQLYESTNGDAMMVMVRMRFCVHAFCSVVKWKAVKNLATNNAPELKSGQIAAN
jgi:hypothetical protein